MACEPVQMTAAQGKGNRLRECPVHGAQLHYPRA
jgi:hypothetical protein